MRKVIGDAPASERIASRDDGTMRASGIAGASDRALLIGNLTRFPSPWQAASLLIAMVLAASSVSEARAEYIEPRAPVHLAQATTNDPKPSQDGMEQGLPRTEAVLDRLAAARRDLESVLTLLSKARDESARPRTAPENDDAELQAALQQERERDGRLEQELAAARRDVETQTALAAKAADELTRDRQAAQGTLAELGTSLQKERERGGRLEQQLAAARRDVETQTALAAKAAEEMTRDRQAAQGTLAELGTSLQQERERGGRLEQQLAAMRRDVETQTALAGKTAEEAARDKQAAESTAVELRKSLQQEREKAEVLAQEVSAARARLFAFEAQARRTGEEAAASQQVTEGTAELRQSLSQQRERAGRLEQELAAARHDVEMQTALAAKAAEETARDRQAAESTSAELTKSLQQARDKIEALTQEGSAARAGLFASEAQARSAGEEAANLKRAAEGTAELKESLSQERERAGRLEQDLAAARRDVEKQTIQAAKASEEAARLTQAAERRTAELQESLQQEREKSESLTKEVSAVRSNMSAEAQARKAGEQQVADLKQAAEGTAELRKSLERERERSGQLEQALATAQHDLETQAALVSKARGEAAQAKQVAESGAAELGKSLQQERERGLRLEQELVLARSTKDVAAVSEGTPRQLTPDRQREADAAAPAPTVGKAQGVAQDDAEAARLMERARVLLGQGDIGSARIVLERAAETGNAQASFALAETYDPLILPKWGTYGTRGDAPKAQALYAKAQAGGIKEAKQRSDALRQ